MRLPRLLIADDRGRVFDHPTLAAAVATDGQWSVTDDMSALPEGAALQALPGWLPVGFDEGEGRFVVLESFVFEGRRNRPRAVGAVVPPGWTRSALPAGKRSILAPSLPQWAYTAAGFRSGAIAVAALRTERRRHWDPRRFSTVDLAKKVADKRAHAPGNRVLQQLETCALRYHCFTAQNIFYGRDEGALPTSTTCNARCVGCISEQPKGAPPSSHTRMEDAPLWNELAEVGGAHLAKATGKTMVSFGQGCEGEPLTRGREMEKAIKTMRTRTSRGSIHINTNGSLTSELERIARAGLDSIRVSLNSADPELYEAYYLPQGYGFPDVERTLRLARRRGLYVALNLLTFPGVTDRDGEVEALAGLVTRHRIDQLQTRPLAIDPLQYVEVAEGRGAGGPHSGCGRCCSGFARLPPGSLLATSSEPGANGKL